MKPSEQLGEILSLKDIFSKKKYRIEIPIIQRDYAQGRESAKDIRHQFLNSIKNHLESNLPLDLDFVYGSIELPNIFIPLDGQQRITTLFLLHYYLAIHDSQFTIFEEIFVSNNYSNLTYETRFTSKDFFDALVNNPLDIPGEGFTFSEVIKDTPWFSYSWLSDPTINSVLNVLDSINEVFKETTNLFAKLITEENLITFQFIELNNFGLADSLYIKMNARGKELTNYENFKAKIEQMFEEYDKINSTNFRNKFTSLSDGVWTDFFWQFKDAKLNTFDKQIMNFFRVSLTNQIVLSPQLNNHQISILVDNKKDLNYYNLQEIGLLNFESISLSMKELEGMIDSENHFKFQLKNKDILDEFELFKKSIENNLSYPERIQLFSLNQYVSRNTDLSGLEDWIRVIRNLTENTRIDDVDRYLACINIVNTLFDYSNEILRYLSIPDNEVKEFALIQLKEERIKALLVLKDEKWMERIFKLENHPYFQGQIGFILDFVGIEDYFDSNKNISWTKNENENFILKFDFYYEILIILFKENGIIEFDNYLFERALLCFEDYLLFSKRNYSFIVNGKDRDISWKRFLRDKNEKRNGLKLLLDSLNTLSSISDQLKVLIENSAVSDWRKQFIKFPQLIDVCGEKKFIRWSEEGNDILLLSKSQTNGYHRELYSFSLMIKLQSLGNHLEYRGSDSVDDDKFISEINNCACKITYKKVNGQYQYVINYKNEEEHRKNEEGVIQYVKELGILI